MLNIFYNIRKTPDFAGKHVILPNPNRITNQKQIAQRMLCDFLYGDEPLRACSHKDQRRTKKRHLRQLDADLLLVR